MLTYIMKKILTTITNDIPHCNLRHHAVYAQEETAPTATEEAAVEQTTEETETAIEEARVLSRYTRNQTTDNSRNKIL